MPHRTFDELTHLIHERQRVHGVMLAVMAAAIEAFAPGLAVRLAESIAALADLDTAIATKLRENVTATAAATTVAGYTTLRETLDHVVAAEQLDAEALHARYAALAARVTAIEQGVRASCAGME